MRTIARLSNGTAHELTLSRFKPVTASANASARRPQYYVDQVCMQSIGQSLWDDEWYYLCYCPDGSIVDLGGFCFVWIDDPVYYPGGGTTPPDANTEPITCDGCDPAPDPAANDPIYSLPPPPGGPVMNVGDLVQCASGYDCRYDPDNIGINNGIALIRAAENVSCYLNLVTNASYCQYAATTGYSTDNLKLSYYFAPDISSQVLQCRNLGAVTGSGGRAYVQTIFAAPDAPNARPLNSIVSDAVTAKFAHYTTFATGTSMIATYLKSRFVSFPPFVPVPVPFPYVAAKCAGFD